MTPLQRLLAWLRGLLGSAESGPEGRVTGRPQSTNGASSFHLTWEIPRGQYVSVAIDLEVAVGPSADELYFWALQASFLEGSRETGAGHIGLQWHPRYPGNTAANWGGYRSGGGELEGTESPLPSSIGNANTRDFPWRSGRTYRLEIAQTPNRRGWWRGSITDVEGGVTSAIRDLNGGGDQLGRIVVWSEVFARCDDPPVTVRWSRPTLIARDGTVVTVGSARVNYQSHADGGCANTTSLSAGNAVEQTTNSLRTTPQGAQVEFS